MKAPILRLPEGDEAHGTKEARLGHPPGVGAGAHGFRVQGLGLSAANPKF